MTMRYRLTAMQIGNEMMPIAIEIASLMTMKNNIVSQPPMQIMLFRKPERTERPQKRAAMT